MAKKTLIIGASTNPNRYSYRVAHKLRTANHPITLLGIKKGTVAGEEILHRTKTIKDIDTVTLYIGVKFQIQYYEFILNLKPKRVIFNPGTENPDFMKSLNQAGIEAFEACTLVMLATAQF